VYSRPLSTSWWRIHRQSECAFCKMIYSKILLADYADIPPCKIIQLWGFGLIPESKKNAFPPSGWFPCPASVSCHSGINTRHRVRTVSGAFQEWLGVLFLKSDANTGCRALIRRRTAACCREQAGSRPNLCQERP
jgi:hypothetical protein